MSTADVLKTPKQMGSVDLTSPGSTSPPPKTTKIVLDDLVFEIEDSPTTSSVLSKLQRMGDGSYRFPNEWNVHKTRSSALFDLLRSTK